MTAERFIHVVAAAFSNVNDTKQHAPCSASALGQLQERVLGEQPPSALGSPVEHDLDHRDGYQDDGKRGQDRRRYGMVEPEPTCVEVG